MGREVGLAMPPHVGDVRAPEGVAAIPNCVTLQYRMVGALRCVAPYARG